MSIDWSHLWFARGATDGSKDGIGKGRAMPAAVTFHRLAIEQLEDGRIDQAFFRPPDTKWLWGRLNGET